MAYQKTTLSSSMCTVTNIQLVAELKVIALCILDSVAAASCICEFAAAAAVRCVSAHRRLLRRKQRTVTLSGVAERHDRGAATR